jgi:hypothetical protein
MEKTYALIGHLDCNLEVGVSFTCKALRRYNGPAAGDYTLEVYANPCHVPIFCSDEVYEEEVLVCVVEGSMEKDIWYPVNFIGFR